MNDLERENAALKKLVELLKKQLGKALEALEAVAVKHREGISK